MDSINIDSMTVEDKYDGPRLEASSGEVSSSGDEGKGKPVVTLDFMKQLMAYYKDRKTLHRRYAFQVSDSQLIWIQPVGISCQTL